MEKEEILAKLAEAVVEMDEELAEKLAKEVIDSGVDAYDAITEGLVKGMKTVSDQYENEEKYLPEVLASANAFYAAFDILKPHMKKVEGEEEVKAVIGVVEGDIHDIGKNLVKTMLEANGCTCIDLGRDVPIENFIEAVAKEKPQFLVLSTLMTPTMKNMQRIIEDLKEEGLRDSVKICIGGGPVDWDFAREIGADFYGDNERDAVRFIKGEV
jgi:corrinoid protein of di/trimethylamine methyltransferase